MKSSVAAAKAPALRMPSKAAGPWILIAPRAGAIKIHGPAAFEGMRKAGALAAATLDFITPYVVPGITTDDLDRVCHDFVADHGAVSAPLNYRGFPKSICTSINHVVCHG